MQTYPHGNPDPSMTPAQGVAKLQCWGGGEVPVPVLDRERPGHDRARDR
jgi:hypothetical protein